jgi:hypothetical protein
MTKKMRRRKQKMTTEEINLIRKRWKKMHRRCNDKKYHGYFRYGGRGITVCEAWNDFFIFLGWAMSSGFAPHLTLERKDNDLGYSPENCTWGTRQDQARNTINIKTYTIDGKTGHFWDFAPGEGVTHRLFVQRLSRGWDMVIAMTTPSMGAKRKGVRHGAHIGH